MRTFRQGDIVRVPFPYTNRETLQRRPALIVSDGEIANGMLLWVLMITSAQNRPWPGDVALPENPSATGLQAASLIRTAKMATIEATSAERIGSADQVTLGQVIEQVRKHMRLP